MDIPSRADISGMADLIRAMGSGADVLSDETSLPAMPSMPAMFHAGQVDPITGLVIEADFSASDNFPLPLAEATAKAQRVPVSSNEQQDMAHLLRTFLDNGGAGFEGEVAATSDILMEDSRAMPELRRAMMTNKTKNGVRIGGWEIISEGTNGKKYHVVSAESGQQIAKNLYLYEAAEALVEYLNKGCMINNIKIQNLLRFEMEYAKYIEDAIQYKHACSRAIDRGDDDKLEVSKIRFNEAKTKAVAAKRKLVEHLKG